MEARNLGVEGVKGNPRGYLLACCHQPWMRTPVCCSLSCVAEGRIHRAHHLSRQVGRSDLSLGPSL